MLETTSTRAAYVSDGDVLVSLSGDAAADAVVTVERHRRHRRASPRTATSGAVSSPVSSTARARIEATAGDDTVALTVTNHSKNGPLFSGPHISRGSARPRRPAWVPRPTPTATRRPSRRGRTSAQDGSVRSRSRIRRRSRPTSATTTVARRDRAVRHPHRAGRDRSRASTRSGRSIPTPGDRRTWDPAGWNDRLVYRFGGGCGTQYSQGSLVHGRRRHRPARPRLRRRDEHARHVPDRVQPDAVGRGRADDA